MLKKNIILLISFCYFFSVILSVAGEPPEFPFMAFYGTVQIDGINVTDTVIKAFIQDDIDHEEADGNVVAMSGKYSLLISDVTDDEADETKPDNVIGNVIIFTIGDYNADQTSIYTPAGYANLNLTVTFPPTKPELLLPTNNSYTNNVMPSFDWTDSTDPYDDILTYTLQIDDNNDFSSLELDQDTTDSDYTLTETLTDNIYFWKVLVSDGYSIVSSDIYTLSIDTTAPQINIIGNGRDTDPVYNNNDVILSATVIDDNIDYVYVEGNWEGILTNYTPTNTGGDSYTYTISSSDLENQENIVYKWYAKDLLGYTNESSEYTFTVQNRAPTLSASTSTSFNEDGFYELDLSSSDLDGDSLTIYTVNVDPKLSLDNVGNVINITSSEEHWYGTSTFDVFVRDILNEASGIQTVTVTVNSVNDIPVISAIPTQNVLEDSGLNSNLNLSEYASDVELSALTFSVVYTDTSKINCAINADGEHLDFTPADNFSGAAYCNVIANDGTVDSEDYKINFNVENVNDNPVITAIADQTATEEVEFTYQVIANDVDEDTLTYSLTTKPDGMIITSTGLIWWTPTNDQALTGTAGVVVNVNDGTTDVTQSFTIIVSNENDLPTTPTLVAPADLTTLYTDSALLNWTASTDVDNDQVTYYVYFSNETDPSFKESTTNTELTVTNLEHDYTYYWYVVAGDLTGNQTKTTTRNFKVSLKNTPVIDEFYPLTDPTVAEAGSQLFNITVSDIDAGDTLTYSWKLDNTEVSTTDSYTFTPNYTQTGTYTLTATVTDSFDLTATKSWTVTVSDTNRAPVFDTITTTPMNEEETLTFNISATDDNGDQITYSSNDTKAVVSKVDNNLATVIFTPATNYFGTYYVKFTASDGTLADEKTVAITVNNVNDNLTITDSSPKTNPSVKSGTAQTFSISVTDIDNTIVPGTDTITVTWYVDDVLEGTGTTRSITKTTSQDSQLFNVRADVTDGTITLQREWNLTVATIPVTETFTSETTDFSTITNLFQATDIVLAKEKGKIDFGDQELDLSEVIDLDNNIIVEDNFVGINTDVLTTLKNHPAELTMKNINLNSPVIYYSEEFTTDPSKFTEECNFCTNVSYNSATGELTFDVAHFTTFMAGEKLLKLDITNLEVKVDSKTDKSITNGQKISKKAKPGSTMKVKMDILNRFTDLKIEDVYVEAKLIGIDDGEDLDDDTDSFDLRKNRDKPITLNFDIPKKVDEYDYDLEINVEGRDENGTDHEVTWTVYLEVDKNRNDIAIERAEINKVSCVKNTRLDLEIVNYGRDEEDEAAYSIFSEELGIDTKSGYFKLSEDLYSEESRLRKTHSIEVPELEPGTYPITIKTFYNKDDSSDTKTIELVVEECEVKQKKVEEKVEVKKPTIIPDKQEKKKAIEIDFTETPEYLALLAGGIIIILVLLILAFSVMVRKK